MHSFASSSYHFEFPQNLVVCIGSVQIMQNNRNIYWTVKNWELMMNYTLDFHAKWLMPHIQKQMTINWHKSSHQFKSNQLKSSNLSSFYVLIQRYTFLYKPIVFIQSTYARIRTFEWNLFFFLCSFALVCNKIFRKKLPLFSLLEWVYACVCICVSCLVYNVKNAQLWNANWNSAKCKSFYRMHCSMHSTYTDLYMCVRLCDNIMKLNRERERMKRIFIVTLQDALCLANSSNWFDSIQFNYFVGVRVCAVVSLIPIFPLTKSHQLIVIIMG